MTEAFGSPSPSAFAYRRADSTFSVWDWTFRADARRAGEFLDIASASRNGVTLTGSGTETVTTARLFEAGQLVHLSDGRIVRADDEGRITFAVGLGPAHRSQQFTPGAETAEELAGGRYWRTRTVRFSPEGCA
jgi:hypothetical protein